LLIELEEKQQWFGYLNRMDRTRIPRMTLEFQFKVKQRDSWDDREK
jgi:hypothetical protein